MPAKKQLSAAIEKIKEKSFEDFFHEDLKKLLNLPLAIDYQIGEKLNNGSTEKTLEVTFRTQNLRLIEKLFKNFPITSSASYKYIGYNDPGISVDQKPSESIPLFTKVSFNYSDLKNYFGDNVNEETINVVSKKVSELRSIFRKNIFSNTLNFDSENNLEISRNKSDKSVVVRNFSSQDHYNLAKNFFTFLDSFFDKYKIKKPENTVIFDDENKEISLSDNFYKLISSGKFKSLNGEKVTIIGRLVNIQHSFINEQFNELLNKNSEYKITTVGDKQKIYNLKPNSILEKQLDILYKDFSGGKELNKEKHFQITKNNSGNEFFLSKEFTNYICRNSSRFTELDTPLGRQDLVPLAKNKNYFEEVLGVKIKENNGFVVIDKIADNKQLFLNHIFNSFYFKFADEEIPFSSTGEFTRGKEGSDLHIKSNFTDKTTTLTMSKRFFDEVLYNSKNLKGYIKEWNQISAKISPELGGGLVK